MWRAIGCTLLLVAATLGAGCAAPPQEHFFMMAYLPPLDPPALQRQPYTLKLRPLEISLAYDRDKIVYRYSQFEFEYYHYQLWAVRPQKMITDLLRRHLEKAGVFDRIVLAYTEHRPDFEISGEILAIEELDSGDSWFAHLAMSFRMTRYRSDRVVWSYEFDRKKPVHNKAPVYVVKALSEIFESEATKIGFEANKLKSFEVEETRGIAVRVVVDGAECDYHLSQCDELEAAGIQPRRHYSSGIMHHKFLVIDGRVLVTGSANWTWSADNENDENIVILEHADLASRFTEEFERLYGG